MEAVRIRLEQIHKTFLHRIKGEVTAVKNVSLEVEPGEFLTLLGPSGCGKTTTLRMVAGFERPDRGRIFIGEEDVTDLMANRRNIGFVFQNYALFPHLSVFENVAYGLKVQGKNAADLEQEVAKVLELVGLTAYGRQFPHQLSGGEQQRVALARAVVIRAGCSCSTNPSPTSTQSLPPSTCAARSAASRRPWRLQRSMLPLAQRRRWRSPTTSP